MQLIPVVLLCLQAAGTSPQAPPERRPVPASSEIRDARKQIEETFKDEFSLRSPDDRKALAQKLLKVGVQSRETPAMQYALLEEAAELAARAGDPLTASLAIDALGDHFTLDTLDLRSDTLKEAARYARTPDTVLALVDACLAGVDDAVRKDEFAAARSLLSKAESAARKTGDVATVVTVKQKKDWVKGVETAYRTVKGPLKTLESDPADPDANLAVGRYFCLAKGDWKTGTFLLMQGSDATLRGLAEQEVAAPKEVVGQVALGDGWWDVSEKERSRVMKRKAQTRAVYWYELALPSITGLDKIRVDKRIDDYYSVGGVTRYVYMEKKSMALHPKGRPFGPFPPQESDDATDIFRGKPVYYNQTTGREAFYEVQLVYPARQVYWKGAAMVGLTFEIQDFSGNVLATGGPYGGGNVWGEGSFDMPPRTRFILRIKNGASNWLMLSNVEFRRTPK